MIANDYPRATEREVASVLLRTFGDEYEKLKATIRAQLQYANAAATGEYQALVPSTRTDAVPLPVPVSSPLSTLTSHVATELVSTPRVGIAYRGVLLTLGAAAALAVAAFVWWPTIPPPATVRGQ